MRIVQASVQGFMIRGIDLVETASHLEMIGDQRRKKWQGTRQDYEDYEVAWLQRLLSSRVRLDRSLDCRGAGMDKQPALSYKGKHWESQWTDSEERPCCPGCLTHGFYQWTLVPSTVLEP